MFLVSQINPMQGGENAHLRYMIPPGTLLKKTGVYKEQQPVKKGRKKTKGQVHPREFLKCYDEQDREIFINMQQNGAFYVVSKNGRPDPISVVQMPEILQWSVPFDSSCPYRYILLPQLFCLISPVVEIVFLSSFFFFFFLCCCGVYCGN